LVQDFFQEVQDEQTGKVQVSGHWHVHSGNLIGHLHYDGGWGGSAHTGGLGSQSRDSVGQGHLPGRKSRGGPASGTRWKGRGAQVWAPGHSGDFSSDGDFELQVESGKPTVPAGESASAGFQSGCWVP